jgi:O-succinylbenzoic acid--CoA ligase
LDEDGRLHVDGRIGDVIVSGGEKIWPESVERAIADRLNDFAVVKLPDPEWGERVLLVHTGVAPSLAEIRDLVKQSLPAYCAPTAMVRVESIPRTASGKVRRSDLAAVVRDMRPDQRH